jgi:mono/diheme cytochrome c family protein
MTARGSMSTRLAPVGGVIVASLLIGVFASGEAGAQRDRVRPDYTSGEYLYRTYCASCHGPGGRGDGPVAGLLRTPLLDLRQIAERAGGTFPRDQVARTIDGRTMPQGHGRPEMPVWGHVLHTTEGTDDRVIRQRITALVDYLETLQVKGLVR